MIIRPALYEDCSFIYRLTMDPSVRAMNTRNELYTLDQHRAWWDRRFSEPTTRMYVAISAANDAIGYVRYGSGEPAAKGEAEVSIAVLPTERGHGVGLSLLTETGPIAAAELGVQRLTALVLPINGSSISLFLRAGYKFVGEEWRMRKQHWRYEK